MRQSHTALIHRTTSVHPPRAHRLGVGDEIPLARSSGSLFKRFSTKMLPSVGASSRIDAATPMGGSDAQMNPNRKLQTTDAALILLQMNKWDPGMQKARDEGRPNRRPAATQPLKSDFSLRRRESSSLSRSLTCENVTPRSFLEYHRTEKGKRSPKKFSFSPQSRALTVSDSGRVAPSDKNRGESSSLSRLRAWENVAPRSCFESHREEKGKRSSNIFSLSHRSRALTISDSDRVSPLNRNISWQQIKTLPCTARVSQGVGSVVPTIPEWQFSNQQIVSRAKTQRQANRAFMKAKKRLQPSGQVQRGKPSASVASSNAAVSLLKASAANPAESIISTLSGTTRGHSASTSKKTRNNSRTQPIKRGGGGIGRPQASYSEYALSSVAVACPKSHKCDVCGKAFSTNALVMRHKMIHSGDRPFPCSVCSKRFRQRVHLKKHMRVHTGERPFVCSFCNSNFTQKSTLVGHVRTKHTFERPYQCSHCTRRFPTRNHLRAHELQIVPCWDSPDVYYLRQPTRKKMKILHQKVSEKKSSSSS
mmetsp:Transcript_15719/g.38774  ORF Transcript_15719/g.38774 Transcript_15719/m.38774 type:complete len:535 (+) Transcript_15719:3-1607(+)